MRLTRVAGLLCVSILMAAESASAQKVGGWISGDVIWMTTRGNDNHVGDVVTEEFTSSGPVTNQISSDTQVFTPIVPRMDTTPTLIIEGGYRGMTWSFGGRAWWVDTDGAEGPTAVSSATSAPPTFRQSSIAMFNARFSPFTDNRETSGLGPTTYHANNTLKNVRIDGYAERLWISGPMGTVSMRFGLGYAKVENTSDDGLIRTGRFTAGASTFSDDDTLNVVSETSVSLLGPTFGITGEMPLGPVQLRWLASPGALFGTTDTSFAVTATEVSRATTTATGATTALSTFTFGTSGADERRALVPVVDLQLKAGYEVIPALTVGGGIFSSTMFNLPLAPTVDLHNEQWNDRSNNVTFFGVSVFAEFSF